MAKIAPFASDRMQQLNFAYGGAQIRQGKESFPTRRQDRCIPSAVDSDADSDASI